MLRSSSKQYGGIHLEKPKEKKERLGGWEGFGEKEGVKPRKKVSG